MKNIIQAILIITMILGFKNYSTAQNLSNMTETSTVTTVELTSFSLLAGTNEAAFIEVANQMQKAFLKDQKGFIKRTLVKGEQGWTDIVYWESPQSMQDAMHKAESSEAVAPFMKMIDFESVQMNLSQVKLNTN